MTIKTMMMKKRKAEAPEAILHRSAEFNTRSVDEKKRTAEISFSSGVEVERYYGTETLSHDESSVRLGRLNNGGALLVEHDRTDQIGVIERAWIEEGRGKAVVRFGKSARAQEIFQDVVDGIRRLVSVGYRIHEEETEKLSGGREAVTATDWEPYELSLVSIPADETVGVGRAMKNTTTNSKNITMSEPTPEAKAPQITPEAAPQVRSIEVVNERPQINAKQERESGASAERSRISGITAIADQARERGIALDVNKAISDGVTADDFRTAAFAKVCEKQQDYTPASSLSRGDDRDIARFDMARALRSCLGSGKLDGIEKEIVDEGFREAKEAGVQELRGIMLPGFFVKRDMTATGGTGGDQGGMTVETQKAGLLDDFYNKSIMRQLGATVMTGLVGNLDIPRLIAGTDPTGKAENATSDEIAPTMADLNLSPNRLPGHVNISKQLLMQSNSAIESVIRTSVTAQMLAVQEKAFFHGTGTNEAEGIATTAGIGSVVGGTNGAAPTYAKMLELEEAVDAQNALVGNLAYASNGQIKKKLKLTPAQASGVEGNFILKDGEIGEYRALFTNAISRTLTKGSSNLASAIFFGAFQDYFIGYWSGLMLDIESDSTLAKQGKVCLIGETYYDGGVQRPKSFAAQLDALGV